MPRGRTLAVEPRPHRLSLRLAGRALGSLRPLPSAFGGLRGPAGLACPDQVAVDRALQLHPGPGLLLALQEVREAVHEQLSAGLEVDRQDVEPPVGGPVGRPCRQPGVEFGCPPRLCPDRGGVAPLQPLGVIAHAWQHHVAVVDLAKDVLQITGAPARGVRRFAEDEAG